MELFEKSFIHSDFADINGDTAEPEIYKNKASKNLAKIQSRLAKELGNNYDENYDIFTEFEMELLGKRVVPDVSVFPIEPSNWKKDVIRGTEAPILAIEILSPKQSYDEVVTKIREIFLPGESKLLGLYYPLLKWFWFSPLMERFKPLVKVY